MGIIHLQQHFLAYEEVLQNCRKTTSNNKKSASTVATPKTVNSYYRLNYDYGYLSQHTIYYYAYGKHYLLYWLTSTKFLQICVMCL